MSDCPICFEVIGDKNCVVTECGHSFHTKCLMQNVAFNGFGCPYCREAMATEVEEEEEEEEEEDDDHALRGMRMFYNRVNGDPHDEEDLEEELDYLTPTVKPTAEFIAQKLSDQGVTVEHFVKAMLKDIQEYESEEEESERLDDELFEKIIAVIRDFQTA